MESSIAPGFLVAAPQLKDPNFEKTVIFMLDHENDEGSLGLVINRPSAFDLHLVLTGMQIKLPVALDVDDQPPLLYGGPVQQERGWILHTPDWKGPDTKELAEGLAVSSSLDVLEKAIAGEGPSKYRFLLGYAGWAPHQLVDEIKVGAWINVPFSVDLIFDVPLDECWSTALGRLGIDPSQLAMTIGDA